VGRAVSCCCQRRSGWVCTGSWWAT
jgi:hypothetical protein